MTWRMSWVAGSIAGRHHRRWEIPQDDECATRSSGGSCGRSVTQWRCMNYCYWLAETRREELDNGGGLLWRTVWSSQPGTPPISPLPNHATMQTRLTRIGTDIVNIEMVTTDDGGRIPAQYQDFTISRFHNIKISQSQDFTMSRFVVSLWDTRTMWTYAAEICQLSHRTYHGMQWEFVRKSDSGSRSVERAPEEMTV